MSELRPRRKPVQSDGEHSHGLSPKASYMLGAAFVALAGYNLYNLYQKREDEPLKPSRKLTSYGIFNLFTPITRKTYKSKYELHKKDSKNPPVVGLQIKVEWIDENVSNFGNISQEDNSFVFTYKVYKYSPCPLTYIDMTSVIDLIERKLEENKNTVFYIFAQTDEVRSLENLDIIGGKSCFSNFINNAYIGYEYQ